jgi:hypothetical protein
LEILDAFVTAVDRRERLMQIVASCANATGSAGGHGRVQGPALRSHVVLAMCQRVIDHGQERVSSHRVALWERRVSLPAKVRHQQVEE